jgi:S-adenosyl-L-methionine hydrolase (adenosine-forming)
MTDQIATPAYNTITFLSDYGTTDEFVGVVHAVVREIAPHVQIVDLTHQIPPYDVKAGSLTLARSIAYLPRGIVLAVVDPGVGTARRAIAVQVAGGEGILIGPDNGLLAPAVAMAGGAEFAVELRNPEYHLEAPGATFAGRDIFAPAAAHLCNGVSLASLGPEVDPAALMPATVPLPRTEGDRIFAEVLWVDRYGNCQLNLGPEDLEGFPHALMLRVGRESDPDGVTERFVRRTTNFAEIGTGALGLVLDSYGMMAICGLGRSAAEELSIAAGDQVVVITADPDAYEAEGRSSSPVTTPVSMRPARGPASLT